MDRDRVLALARQADFLRVLGDDTLRRVVEQAQVRTLAAGDPVFEDGDEGRSCFVVLEGELVVLKRGRQIASGGPGQYFGEMALIEGKPRSAGLMAVAPSTVLEIPATTFDEHVASAPAALRSMLKTMAERSRHDLSALAASNEQLHHYASSMEHTNRELNAMRKELEAKNRQLEELSTSDTLTGIPNRRRFEAAFAHEWRRASRENSPLSILLCDIDFFKGYNDAYGHPAGDECLVRVARTLVETFRRPGDLVARYGGEEFVVLLPATGEKGALALAERMRSRVEALAIPHRSSAVQPVVTISLGVTTEIPGANSKPEQLLERADRALYAAKQQGRNRVQAAAG